MGLTAGTLSIFGNTKTEDTLKALGGIGAGLTYYVNNITGDSGNDGLSWNSAMDEVSTAVTASETYRALAASGNDNVRNTIVIQGTDTAYTALTDVGEHVNLIGLGDNMLGNVAGIARIGADSGTGYGITTTTTARGVNFYNLQFQGGGNNSVVKFTNIFRSTYEYCGFFTNGNPVTSPSYGFRIIGTCGGLHLKDCHWGNASGHLAGVRVGMSIEHTHYHICIVEGCHITGQDIGVFVDSDCVNAWGSVFRNCYIGGDAAIATVGVDDDSTTGHIIWMNCFMHATTDFALANDATGRVIGCITADGFVT